MNFRRAPHNKLTPQPWAVRLVWRNREDTARAPALEKAEGTKGKKISISCRRANDVVCSRAVLRSRKEISNANTIPSMDETISKNSWKGLARFSKARRGMSPRRSAGRSVSAPGQDRDCRRFRLRRCDAFRRAKRLGRGRLAGRDSPRHLAVHHHNRVSEWSSST